MRVEFRHSTLRYPEFGMARVSTLEVSPRTLWLLLLLLPSCSEQIARLELPRGLGGSVLVAITSEARTSLASVAEGDTAPLAIREITGANELRVEVLLYARDLGLAPGDVLLASATQPSVPLELPDRTLGSELLAEGWTPWHELEQGPSHQFLLPSECHDFHVDTVPLGDDGNAEVLVALGDFALVGSSTGTVSLVSNAGQVTPVEVTGLEDEDFLRSAVNVGGVIYASTRWRLVRGDLEGNRLRLTQLPGTEEYVELDWLSGGPSESGDAELYGVSFSAGIMARYSAGALTLVPAFPEASPAMWRRGGVVFVGPSEAVAVHAQLSGVVRMKNGETTATPVGHEGLSSVGLISGSRILVGSATGQLYLDSGAGFEAFASPMALNVNALMDMPDGFLVGGAGGLVSRYRASLGRFCPEQNVYRGSVKSLARLAGGEVIATGASYQNGSELSVAILH
ncbi:MAG: hypothetical protein HYV07_01170 [Deltaproteobacteria bacterium]|nr:hypothetical protein [Deltaproteobacteria bacterium]